MILFQRGIAMQQQETNFMDRRTIIAIILMGVVFFAWQKHMTTKYPPVAPETAAQTEQAADGAVVASGEVAVDSNTQPGTLKAPTIENSKITREERLFQYEDESISFAISSYGMGLKQYTLKSYTTRDGQPIQMGGAVQRDLFATSILGSRETLVFDVKQTSENTFEGTAQSGTATIIKKVEVIREKSALKIQTFVQNADNQFRGLVISVAEAAQVSSGGSFFMPSFDHQDFVVSHSGTIDRVNSTASRSAVNETFNQVAMAGISSQYFASAILDKSDVLPEVRLEGGAGAKDLVADLIYKPQTIKDVMEFNTIAFAGPKSSGLLSSVDSSFYELINFGWFAAIAKVLLHLLQWFHGFVPNWGFSIILLTLLVRVLVLPFNISSYKSMKKMQVIQPLVKSLQEKYKDKPEILNQEMMKIWKEHKVNPLGGCLPMLLQLPIFFALFQVLGQAIELYQAPFLFWISDLSVRDPLFILPALMALSMWIQQKITPTTMDPKQAKLMQYIILLFVIPMAFFPSGLALYTCVSTIFGVVQQQIFMRDKSTAQTVQAKA